MSNVIPYESASNVERLFPSFQHPGKPIDSGIGVASPHGLVQRTDEIVVLFPGFIISQVLALQRLLGILQRHNNRSVLRSGSRRSSNGSSLQGIERHSSVAIAIGGNEANGIFFNTYGGSYAYVEAVDGIVHGAGEEGGQVVGLQGFEDQDAAAGEERRGKVEGRVLGGGADEDDTAVFDNWEEGVELGLVEAVDLVYEEQCGHFGPGLLAAGFVDGVSDVLDAGGDGGEGDEAEGAAGDGEGEGAEEGAGDGGLAGAGWAPEDEGGEAAAIHGGAEEGGFSGEEVVLANDVV